MTDLVITSVRIVESTLQETTPASEIFAVGEIVRYDTDGLLTPGNGTAAGEADIEGVAVKACTYVNEAVTIVRKGYLDVGDALSALAPGALVYASDTDGQLADAAGTVPVVVGQVTVAWGNTTADKLLYVDL